MMKPMIGITMGDVCDTGPEIVAKTLAGPEVYDLCRPLVVGDAKALLDAVKRITAEPKYEVISLAHETLVRSGRSAPRIALCEINPHAGEHGLFGYGEEEEKLIPGIERVAREGINVTGPWPGDTVMSIEEGVNVTVGLKGGIIRTSVDHGTAFDIAGKNIARHDSLIAATRFAVEPAPRD